MKSLMYFAVAVAAIAGTIVLFEHSPALRQVGFGALGVGGALMVSAVVLALSCVWLTTFTGTFMKVAHGQAELSPGIIAKIIAQMLWFPAFLLGGMWMLISASSA